MLYAYNWIVLRMNETLHIKSVKRKIHAVVNDYITAHLPYTYPPKPYKSYAPW
jgi:hypothetical protein